MARAFDIGVTAWSPLGSGVLTGKYNRENQRAREVNRASAMREMLGDDWVNSMLSDRNMLIAEEVQKVANEIGPPLHRLP